MKKKLFLDTLYIMLNSPDLEFCLFYLLPSWLTIQSTIVCFLPKSNLRPSLGSQGSLWGPLKVQKHSCKSSIPEATSIQTPCSSQLLHQIVARYPINQQLATQSPSSYLPINQQLATLSNSSQLLHRLVASYSIDQQLATPSTSSQLPNQLVVPSYPINQQLATPSTSSSFSINQKLATKLASSQLPYQLEASYQTSQQLASPVARYPINQQLVSPPTSSQLPHQLVAGYAHIISCHGYADIISSHWQADLP